MDKEKMKKLLDQQYKLARLMLEEKTQEKTAIEATENQNYQLLVAAFQALNKAVLEYLI